MKRAFDRMALRRKEIERLALHTGHADSDDFEHILTAWVWGLPHNNDPVWALMGAAKRMGGNLNEAEAEQIVAAASVVSDPPVSDDAVGAWLRLTYPERQKLKITTIGSIDVSRRGRALLRKRRRRDRERERRKRNGAKPHSESLAQTKPWLAMGISQRTYYRRGLHRHGTVAQLARIHAPPSFFLPSHESLPRQKQSVVAVAACPATNAASPVSRVRDIGISQRTYYRRGLHKPGIVPFDAGGSR